MSVLLFGYSPFLEFDENPSQIVAEKLDGQKIRDNEIKSIILPVDYSKVENLILDAINKYDPALIIGLGLAPGRSKITIEKIAINYIHSDVADNAGNSLNGELIDMDQSDGIFSTLPVELICKRLNSEGIPSSISLSAGGYLCNYAMFIIAREAKKLGIKGGFIHIPCHDGFISKNPKKEYPSMDLNMIFNAIKLAIDTSLQ